MVEFTSTSLTASCTLALQLSARVQRDGGVAAFIDARQELELEAARRVGVSPSELLIAQPGTLLRAVELVKHIVRSGAVDLVVVDSLQDLDLGDKDELRKASEELRQLVVSTSYTNATVLFLTRKPINKPGGALSNTLRYLSAIRCEVVAIGRHARVRVLKNKHATPFTEATIELEASEDLVAALVS